MTANKPHHTAGLVFKKLDLHIHTPASTCFADRSATAEQIVAHAKAIGLAGIAVTDHNSGAWIDIVKGVAARENLTVFPGVEITCMGGSGGIHIIALFDPSHGRADVEGLLAALGLKPAEYGDITAIVQKDPVTVCKVVAERGGLAVLAHANSSKGVLQDMKGEQRTVLIQSPYVSAAEGTDFQDKAGGQRHKRVVDLLDGTDPVYKRKLAVYQASDNPTGIGDGRHAIDGIGSRCSYFKVDQVNLEGLRQCLADPEVRIRQDFEPTLFKYPRISIIKINGGFLDGAQAQFHEGLNSILGAKGAGKSLLIEFMRFVLDQPSENENIRSDYESKLASRLENYGTVELTLVDDTGKAFAIKRTYNPAENHPYEGGQAYDMAQLFPALFLSQNEIIKIAENEEAQIAFIDRFFDFRTYQQEIADLDNSFEQFDAELGEAFRALQGGRQLEQAIATATKEIEQLDGALKNPAFDQYSFAEGKNRALSEQAAFVSSLRERVTVTKGTFDTVRMPTAQGVLADDPAVKRALDISKEAKEVILTTLDGLLLKIAGLEKRAAEELKKWATPFSDAKKAYEAAVLKSGGDYKNLAQKRAKRVKDLEGLRIRFSQYKEKSDRIKEISTRRQGALQALRSAYERYSKERQDKCAKIEAESGSRLIVRIHESSNVDEFRERLTALKRGSYLRDQEIDAICAKSDPGTFVRAVVRHAVFKESKTLAELATATGLDESRLRILADFLSEEFPIEHLLSLEHKAIPQDRPEIRYHIGGTTYEPLDRLSVGQKCTAMLIIALSDGSIPIIIDQPEDSLDIRSIWDDMCLKIRRGKERRQFIFTTHNSSLAVASDTDKYIIMEADATHGMVKMSGSMDHSPINEEVIDFLEGGKETYRTKFGKYRIEKSD